MANLSVMTRREALWAAGIGSVLGFTGVSAFADEGLADLALQAYIWGRPLVQTRLYLEALNKRGFTLNQFYGAPRLATPADKGAAGPNVDTLYGVAWLDLSSGPQVFSVPDTHDRYYSVQLMDAYETSFAYIGRRATGTHASHHAITGPNWQGTLPDGVTRLAAPTNTVAVLTRTLVDGPQDVTAALAIQAQYTLTPLSKYPAVTTQEKLVEDAVGLIPVLHPERLGLEFFDVLGVGLADYPPSPADRAFVASLAPLGIGPGKKPSQTANTGLRDILVNAVTAGDIQARRYFKSGSTEVNGWRVRYNVKAFGRTPLERAAESIYGIGFNIAEEALYFFLTRGPDGKALDGGTNYVLHFPGGQTPPVAAFWSLTLYGPDFFLQANTINRYAIGDRTAGLQRERDGSLKIYIQHAKPPAGVSNWLPAPIGSFQLLLRTYQPRLALQNGTYRVPPIVIA